MANYYYHHSPDKNTQRSVLCVNLERFWCDVKEAAASSCSLLSSVDFVCCSFSLFPSVPGVIPQEHNPADVGVS